MKSQRLIFVAIFLIATSLSASTFVALDSDEMIRQSQRVVQGTVIGVDSFWDRAGRIVVSEATIQIGETILGSQHESVVKVRVPGGQVGRFKVVAEGFPVFARGQQVVLFLNREGDADFHRVVGHQQGHFEVVQRRDGVALAVPQIEDGARLFHADGRQMAPARSTELETFKAMVRDAGRQLGRVVR